MPKETPEKLFVLVGRRIAEIRKREGLTQAQLAERLEFSVQYLSRVELGTNLTLGTMVKIANAIGVKVIELMQPGANEPVRRGRPRKTR